MRIVVVHRSAAFFEEVEERVGWRLPVIVHIGLVGQAEEEDAAAVYGLLHAVEGEHRLFHHVLRHGGVHLAGEFDEARVYAKLAGLPREVERVDRNAVSAEAGSGGELHEAKRLRGCRVEHLVYVDAHRVVHHLEFVHQRDVNRAEDILRELHRLRRLAVRDRHRLHDRHVVHRLREGEGLRPVSAHHLRDERRVEVRVARVFAFGTVRHEEVRARLQAAEFLEDRDHHLLRSARVGGRLQDHEVPLTEVAAHRAGSLHHVGHVRLAVFIERRRHTEQQRIRLREAREVSRRRAALTLRQRLHHLRTEVLDVRDALREAVHLPRIDIKPHHREARLVERPHQRQPHIAQAQNAHRVGAGGEFSVEVQEVKK